MTWDSPEFAVTDVETTGLFPGGTDRVIEIAIVRVSQEGAVLDEYCTLVNPGRDVGPTHVHGIRAGDVLEAPRFDQILGDVLALMAGAVFVAHNVSFDARFLRAEMTRAGYELPGFPELCTMRLSRLADPSIPSRRLSDLCSHFDVDPGRAHSALDDARATAGLLAACLGRMRGDAPLSLDDLGVYQVQSNDGRWPTVTPSGKSLARAEAARRRTETPSFIAQLVARLPVQGAAAPEVLAYQALLDRVLEDRRVSPDEGAALDALAGELGLSRAAASEVHEGYLLDLLRVALEDGFVSELESEDLREVQRLLAVGDGAYARLETRAREGPVPDRPSRAAGDLDGKSICFTGAMRCKINGERAERSLAEEIAVEAGMIVKKGVSKKLDILVLADPDSLSGKANRARELGVRLVAEPVFWQMMGIAVE